jgi:glycerate dehydrogenase
MKAPQSTVSNFNIVFLDAKTIGEDIDLSGFDALGNVTRYDFSTEEQARERSRQADVLILNKVPINERSIGEASHLKLVCVTATGTDNLDKDYLAARGIAWRNVAGYSTESVAQHTFAMLFYLLEKLRYYDDYVKSEQYVGDVSFSHFSNHFHELCGMTWGIIGMGNIGRRVAEIARLFGCRVIYFSTSGKNNQPGYERVGFEELLAQSDVVSVHAPLTDATRGLMNAAAFSQMKPSAIFLNLGRGPIVAEQDLADALTSGTIAAAGLDVLCAEPMRADNPLRAIKDSEKLLITPHIAWASVEARTRLMDIIQGQIREVMEHF